MFPETFSTPESMASNIYHNKSEISTPAKHYSGNEHSSDFQTVNISETENEYNKQ